MDNKENDNKINVKYYTLCFCYSTASNNVFSESRCFYNYDDLMSFILSGKYSICFDTVKIFIHTDKNLSFMQKLTLIPYEINTVVY